MRYGVLKNLLRLNFTSSVLATKAKQDETKATATTKEHKETFGGDVYFFTLIAVLGT